MNMSDGLKQKMGNGQILYGQLVFELLTPGLGPILKQGGMDYAMLDMEHGAFSYEQIKWGLASLDKAGIHGIVRPPSSDSKDIARALDVGAEGLLVPMVRGVEDCQRIVSAMKYTPEGTRGVIVRSHFDGFEAMGVNEHLSRQNNRTVLWPLIETREALDEIEAIAALKGVDAIFIGEFDLSASLGLPGQLDHPDVCAAISRIEAAAKAANTPLAAFCGNHEIGKERLKRGYQMITASSDAWTFADAIKANIAQYKNLEAEIKSS